MNLCAGRAHGQEFVRLFVNLFTPDPTASILVTEHNLLHLPPHKPQPPTSPLIMFLKFYVMYTSKHAKKSTKHGSNSHAKAAQRILQSQTGKLKSKETCLPKQVHATHQFWKTKVMKIVGSKLEFTSCEGYKDGTPEFEKILLPEIRGPCSVMCMQSMFR